MENTLKLNSADIGVNSIRIPTNLIECYFDIDPEKSDFEMFMEEQHIQLMAWADRVIKIVKRSKAEEAKELIDEYEELYEEFFDKVDELKETTKFDKYSVIKLHSQTLYRVKESLEELDQMFNDIEMNEKYGTGFNNND